MGWILAGQAGFDMRPSMGLGARRFLQLGGMPSVEMLLGAMEAEAECRHYRCLEDEVGVLVIMRVVTALILFVT
jgi:hypothetical protein